MTREKQARKIYEKMTPKEREETAITGIMLTIKALEKAMGGLIKTMGMRGEKDGQQE